MHDGHHVLEAESARPLHLAVDRRAHSEGPHCECLKAAFQLLKFIAAMVPSDRELHALAKEPILAS